MAEEEKTKTINLTLPIIVILLMVASFLVGLSWTKIREEKLEEQKQVAQATPTPEQPVVLGEELKSTIGNFLVTEDKVCQENGKPIIYMFGSSGCPHCTWEHPIFERATAKFGNKIVIHDNMDKLDADKEVFQQYSQINQGAIPFIVLGCHYVRLGSGERMGEVTEEKNITALICKLTDGQPEKVCTEVEGLVDKK